MMLMGVVKQVHNERWAGIDSPRGASRAVIEVLPSIGVSFGTLDLQFVTEQCPYNVDAHVVLVVDTIKPESEAHQLSTADDFSIDR